MPQVAAQEAYSWKPSLMTGFLEKFLTFIRDVMAKVEDVAYVFEWNPEWEGICFTFDPDKTKGKSSPDRDAWVRYLIIPSFGSLIE